MQLQLIFGLEGLAWGWWKGHPLESEDEALVNMKGKGRETFCHSVLLFAIYIFLNFHHDDFHFKHLITSFFQSSLFLLDCHDSPLNFSEDNNITHFKVLFYLVYQHFHMRFVQNGVDFPLMLVNLQYIHIYNATN